MTPTRKGGLPWQLIVGGLLICSVVSLYAAFKAGMADLAVSQARWLVTQWQKSPASMPADAEWKTAEAGHQAALAWQPDDAEIKANLGYLYSLAANRPGLSAEQRHQALRQALEYQRQSLQARPMSGHGWSNTMVLMLALGETGSEFWQSYDRAVAYGWREDAIRQRIAQVCFVRWDEAGPERQVQLRANILSLPENLQAPLLRLAVQHGRYHLLKL